MIDYMLDIESLGNIPGCVVTQVSLVPFNINGKPFESEEQWIFNERLHIGEQIGLGLDVDVDTLKWWMQQDPAVRRHVMSGNMMLEEFFRRYTLHFKDTVATWKDYRVWSTSAKVDFGCVPVLFKRLDVPYPLYHRNERCARTLLEHTKLMFPEMKLPKVTVTHDAIEDCKKQILDVRLATNNTKMIFGQQNRLQFDQDIVDELVKLRAWKTITDDHLRSLLDRHHITFAEYLRVLLGKNTEAIIKP
jgi:hypothetical protein